MLPVPQETGRGPWCPGRLSSPRPSRHPYPVPTRSSIVGIVRKVGDGAHLQGPSSPLNFGKKILDEVGSGWQTKAAMAEKKVGRITIRFTPAEHAQLRRLAREQGRTVAGLCRFIIESSARKFKINGFPQQANDLPLRLGRTLAERGG